MANKSELMLITPPYHCGVVEVAGRWVPLNLLLHIVLLGGMFSMLNPADTDYIAYFASGWAAWTVLAQSITNATILWPTSAKYVIHLPVPRSIFLWQAIYRVVLESRSEVVVAVTSDLDAVVELRRGCSEGHEALACVDDDPDARHTGLSVVLGPGEYFLLVDSYSPDAGGPFHLEVSITPQDEEREP